MKFSFRCRVTFSSVTPESTRSPATGSALPMPSMIGLITSTLLSLLVVPAVFTYIDDLEQLLRRGVGKLRRHPHDEAAHKITLGELP